MRERVSKARNDGLFTPPALIDTDLDAGQPGRIELGHHRRQSRRRDWCSSSTSTRWRSSSLEDVKTPHGCGGPRRRGSSAGRVRRVSAALQQLSRGQPAGRVVSGRRVARRRDRSDGRRRGQGDRHRRPRPDASRAWHHRRRIDRAHRLSGQHGCESSRRERPGRSGAGLSAGTGRGARRRTAAAGSAAQPRAVLPGARRQCGQLHLSGRGRRSAGDEIHERLRRARLVDQAALYDDHGLRSQHRATSSGRCRTAIIRRRWPPAAHRTPAGSAPAAAWS